MENEIWKDIEGTDGTYMISTHGRVKSFRKYDAGKILKQHLTKKGYPALGVKINGETKQVRVHRLVASAFISNEHGKSEVNHKDGIKTNNFIDNLEWTTPRENHNHAMENGLKRWASGNASGRAKMTSSKVHRMRLAKEITPKITQETLGDMFNISQPQVSCILSGRNWK